MSIFKSQDQRERYMRALGTYYAGLGGTFGVYRTAKEAFDTLPSRQLYARVGVVETDFPAFEDGFLTLQAKRIDLQKTKGAAEKAMKEILIDENVDLLGIKPVCS